MIFRIRLSNWGDILEIGDVVEDDNDVEIKVVSIIKVETDEGNIFVYVSGVKPSDLGR